MFVQNGHLWRKRTFRKAPIGCLAPKRCRRSTSVTPWRGMSDESLVDIRKHEGYNLLRDTISPFCSYLRLSSPDEADSFSWNPLNTVGKFNGFFPWIRYWRWLQCVLLHSLGILFKGWLCLEEGFLGIVFVCTQEDMSLSVYNS